MDIKKKIKEYNEQFYVHEFDNLKKTDEFLKDADYQNSHKKK